MKPLLGPEGLAALDRALAGRPLVAFDFDGTLAPIVEHPDDARVPPALVPRLARLAELVPVAIISGRAVADVARRLAFEPHHVIGNHGAEDPSLGDSGSASLDAEVDQSLAALRARIAAVKAELTSHGVEVEDKGHSMALHYRRAPDRERARSAIADVVTGLDPALTVYGGKEVVNIVVAAAPDKGKALLSLVQRGGFDAAFFAGDDVNDESVFERALPGWVTARVGPAPDSSAQFCLSSIDEMPHVIEAMIDRLTRADRNSPG